MNKTNHSQDKWDAHLYDNNHSFVSKFGSALIDLLAPQQGEQILDVGCGTGDLAAQLYDLGVHVTGIDQSENMILQAKTKYPHLNFTVKDVLNLEYNNEFDAIFSNATLHWVKSPQPALQAIYTSLKQGGRFVAEFGGKGNVQAISKELIQQINNNGIEYQPETFPWYFPSIGEYTSLMEKVGFNVAFAHHFDRPTPLEGSNGVTNWIEMFCGGMLTGISEERKEIILTNVESNLKDVLLTEDTWIADYKRIRVIGTK